MEYSFFDAVNYDRLYNSADWSRYFKLFIGNGVYAEPANGMQVYSKSGMTLGILEGNCFINGRAGYADGSDTVTLAYGSGGAYRYDAVCARLDLNERDIHIEVIKGTDSASLEGAVKPSPVRTSIIHDLVLAYVLIEPGATSLSDTKLTDMRPDNDVCGFVTGVVEQFSSTNFFRQYTAMLTELLASLGEDDRITINLADSSARTDLAAIKAQLPYSITGLMQI